MALAVIGSDAYKWLLAFHILLAVVWVGSDVAIQIFVMRAKRAGSDRVAYFAREIEWYGTRVLVPSSLALVILGFILLHESSGASPSASWSGCSPSLRARRTSARSQGASATWSTTVVRRTRSISAG